MKIRQVLIAIDQLANTLLAGYADETLSARAYRNRSSPKRRWRFAFKCINAIFFWQENHCKVSYEEEALRRHLPPEYRI
jgi:hypothetical protein